MRQGVGGVVDDDDGGVRRPMMAPGLTTAAAAAAGADDRSTVMLRWRGEVDQRRSGIDDEKPAPSATKSRSLPCLPSTFSPICKALGVSEGETACSAYSCLRASFLQRAAMLALQALY